MDSLNFLLRDRECVTASEYIGGRLYFATYRYKKHRRNTQEVHFFNTDDALVYHGFFSDFGPLDLGKVFKYVNLLKEKLSEPSLERKKIVHWTTLDAKKRANAAFLMAAFGVIHLNLSPKEALSPLNTTKYPFLNFQDANISNSIYTISLLDCMLALNKAFYFGLVDFNDFNVRSYEYYESMVNGDMTWIVPNKLLAFSSPSSDKSVNSCPPEYYLNYFKSQNVTLVVRLNKVKYDAKKFTQCGIRHVDLYFLDGSVPPASILREFLMVVEGNPHSTAVHCKAGLGRTGCLIGAYLMKHYMMTASEAIAWMRICRPGCVIGHQQRWLEENQAEMWKQGNAYRTNQYGGSDKVPHHKFGIYSLKEDAVGCNNQRPASQGAKRFQFGHKAWVRVDRTAKRSASKPPSFAGAGRSRGETETQGDILQSIKLKHTRLRSRPPPPGWK